MYALDLVFFQHGGEATLELFAAAGSFGSFNETTAWRLVGDVANGGLATTSGPTAVPEPPALALLGLGAGVAGLVARRRGPRRS
ncbi:PEP-CTERM sorting domain-containing protein [Paludisphaera soli]|uniref:PEP-CTERM sorting domain-containing protein n=1 Tax=Paludisphaera soli TaxID=2712865 RepID=UPI0013ED2565|nr:PEP-CTERM sorting domain-containing protein [Paludisphaera soli]